MIGLVVRSARLAPRFANAGAVRVASRREGNRSLLHRSHGCGL